MQVPLSRDDLWWFLPGDQRSSCSKTTFTRFRSRGLEHSSESAQLVSSGSPLPWASPATSGGSPIRAATLWGAWALMFAFLTKQSKKEKVNAFDFALGQKQLPYSAMFLVSILFHFPFVFAW